MNRKIESQKNHTAYVGHRQIWGGQQPFGLRPADRQQHVYVCGKTGTGKSTLLKNIILHDVDAGEGVGLIDPHGDLAEDILNYIPPRRSRDVVYFNAGDADYPVAMNLLAGVKGDGVHLLTSGIVGAFKSIWRDSWGPRLEYILSTTIAALAECENATLLGVQRMLTDEKYRSWVLGQVLDPAVRSFWLFEWAEFDKRFTNEAISPILNKVGQLLLSPAIRNVLGQVQRTIDPRFMMDHRRIFIANLSKGTVGEDKSSLLGALLVTQFEHAALSRHDTPEHERQNFHLFVDEFPSFITDSFAGILSEARKYKLGLTLSNQHLGQIPRNVQDAILGNVGSVIAFRVGESDAETLEREFGRSYTASHFTALDNYEVLVKLLEDGKHREPFVGKTFPPHGRYYGRRDKLIHLSRQHFASERSIVEEKINRWMGSR